MATLTIDYITSLDGFGAATDWPGFWGLAGPEYLEFLGRDADPDATMLMGAHTYLEYARMIDAGEPGMDSMAAPPKVVFSSTLREPLIWENARLVAGDAVEAVRE